MSLYLEFAVFWIIIIKMQENKTKCKNANLDLSFLRQLAPDIGLHQDAQLLALVAQAHQIGEFGDAGFDRHVDAADEAEFVQVDPGFVEHQVDAALFALARHDDRDAVLRDDPEVFAKGFVFDLSGPFYGFCFIVFYTWILKYFCIFIVILFLHFVCVCFDMLYLLFFIFTFNKNFNIFCVFKQNFSIFFSIWNKMTRPITNQHNSFLVIAIYKWIKNGVVKPRDHPYDRYVCK